MKLPLITRGISFSHGYGIVGLSIIMNKGHIGGGNLASCRSLLIYIYFGDLERF